MSVITDPMGTRTARLLALASILALAVFLRTYSIDTLPPGLYNDEAENGLDALDILEGKYSVFFERNYGREPLFIYAQAASVYLLGNNAMALRAVAGLFGVLTVWATYLLANAWFGSRVGLLSAAGIASSFWHVGLSRVGFRAITVPFFLLLVMYFLWKALISGRRMHFLAAGMLTGLSLYTYISARLIPLLLLLILALQLAVDRERLLARWRGLAVMPVVALLVFLPLGAYFYQHPGALFSRIEQASIIKDAPDPEGDRTATFRQNLPESLTATAGMFFISGDHNWRHNFAGRPVFNPIAAAFFAVGLLWILANLARGPNETNLGPGWGSSRHSAPLRLLPTFWLALWLATMSLPGILSQESPHFLRLTAIAPAVYIVASLGTNATWNLISRRSGARGSHAFLVAVVILLGVDGVSTFHDYFDDWAKRSEVYWAFDADRVEEARFLDELDGGVAYPSLFLYGKPSATVVFLAPRYRARNWLGENPNFVSLPGDSRRDAFYLTTPGPLQDALRDYFPDAEVYYRPDVPSGGDAFTVQRIPADQVSALQAPQRPLRLDFGSDLELLGVLRESGLNDGIRPGGVVTVDLLWRVLNSGSRPYNFFVHILDAGSRRWAQKDVSGARLGGWRHGDLLVTRHAMKIPSDAPAVSYRLVAGVSLPETGERIMPSRGDGDNTAKLGNIRVFRNFTLPQPEHKMEADFGDQIKLLGYDLKSFAVKPGQELELTVYWQALASPRINYTVFTHLLDGGNAVVGQKDNQPVQGQYPTDGWLAGEVIRDEYKLKLSERPASQELQLEIGWYDAASGKRLKVAGGKEDRVILGTVMALDR